MLGVGCWNASGCWVLDASGCWVLDDSNGRQITVQIQKE
jgi:hypothetical protein